MSHVRAKGLENKDGLEVCSYGQLGQVPTCSADTPTALAALPGMRAGLRGQSGGSVSTQEGAGGAGGRVGVAGTE